MPRAIAAVTWVAALLLVALLTVNWVARVPYPFDLEWMEGGMLAHAWRMRQELPVYPEPGPEWVPYIYPPGYPAIVAALASFTRLHPALGRVVSLLGVLLACGALGQALRRRGASWTVVLGLTACFLGTYPSTGAFFDLVRPDGVYIGLTALAVALALDGRRGTSMSSGLVLAAAFLVKHNAATFGLPILLGLLLRDRRQALVFAASSLGPALGLTAYLQWRTGGRFLAYLLEVPASHPTLWGRFWPGALNELGPAVGILAATGALAAVLDLARRGPLPLPLAAGLPVLLGAVLTTLAGFTGLAPDLGLSPATSVLASFGAGTALGWAVLRGLVLRRVPARADDVMVFAVLVTAFVLAGLMRAHNGGFVNVHLHLFWAVCLAFGWVSVGTSWVRVLPVQIVASLVVLVSWDLRPDPEARAAGEELVEALRKGDGPILSPFAAWLPVYAGEDPSVHYMALWDLDYRRGPFQDRLDGVRKAVRRHRWTRAVQATRPFPYGLDEAYAPDGDLDVETALEPPTGWEAAPRAVWVPKK